MIVGREARGRCGHRRTARGVAAALSLSVVLVACGGLPSSASSTSSAGSTSTTTPHALSGVTVTGPVRVGSPDLQQHPLWHKLRPVKGRLREVSVLPLGHRPLLRASAAPHQRREVEDHDWRERAVQDTDSRLPSDRPEEVQRDGRGRVAQCVRRDDDAPDWTLSHNELVRDGFAWVGVSAQQVGVDAAKIHRSGRVLVALAPGRQLLVRHLFPGWPSGSRRRSDDPGGLAAAHADCGR